MFKKYFETIPREHGVWYIFLFSFLVGSIIFYDSLFKELVIFLLSLFGIFSYNTLTMIIKEYRKKKTFDYVIPFLVNVFVFSILLVYIILKYRFYILVPLGVVVSLLVLYSLYLVYSGKDLSVTNEVLSIVSLSFVVIVIGLLSGENYLKVINLWFFTLLFFLSSIFRVRYLIRKRKVHNLPLSIRLKDGIYSITYHTLMLLLAVIVSIYFRDIVNVSFWFFLIFIPVFLRSLYIIIRKYKTPPNVRTIGYSEVANSLVFLILVIIVYKIK